MLDPKTLKKDIDLISENLDKKNFHLDKDLFLLLDSNRKNIIIETENLQSKKNTLSKEIGILKSKGKNVENLTSKVELINLSLKDKKKLLDNSETQFRDFLLNIPNILDKNVPSGNSEKDNKIIRFSNDEDLEKSNKEKFLDHSAIGKALQLYDSDIASKII